MLLSESRRSRFRKTRSIKAELLRGSEGAELYSATFITRYNTETDIYEKNLDGDLVYRLKINPQVDEHK